MDALPPGPFLCAYALGVLGYIISLVVLVRLRSLPGWYASLNTFNVLSQPGPFLLPIAPVRCHNPIVRRPRPTYCLLG